MDPFGGSLGDRLNLPLRPPSPHPLTCTHILVETFKILLNLP